MTSPNADKVAPTRAYGLNVEYFKQFAQVNGWMNDGGYNFGLIGARLGITGDQVRRVVKRKTRHGIAFMAGLRSADPNFRMSVMFPLVNASDPIGKD